MPIAYQIVQINRLKPFTQTNYPHLNQPFVINVIAACGHNRVIGNKGKLPWSISEDWEYFLETTKDGILIMGRRCYQEFESFASGREVIALSRDPSKSFEHAWKAESLAEAIQICNKKSKTAWICGGREIYEESLPFADNLYMTLIDAPFVGDVFFPPWEEIFKKEQSRSKIRTKYYDLTFLVLEK